MLQKYQTLTKMVRQDHLSAETSKKGHDFYHAYRVAQCAKRIAENERVAELGWVAGIVHNSDHLFPGNISENLKRYFEATSLCAKDWHLIIEAVQNHSERNGQDDNAIQICLMDADKVVCMELDVIIRAAQFVCHLPIYDPRFVFEKDPTADYRNPKTILRDIQGCLEWVEQEGWFRLPKARALAQERYNKLKAFHDDFAAQLAESGVLSPEFPEKFIV